MKIESRTTLADLGWAVARLLEQKGILSEEGDQVETWHKDSCEGDADETPINRRYGPNAVKVNCPKCQRRVKEVGLAQHMRDKHDADCDTCHDSIHKPRPACTCGLDGLMDSLARLSQPPRA